MESSEYLSTVEAMHGEGQRRGLYFQTLDDTPLQGRQIRVGGQDLLGFHSCSYLGLEFHPDIIAGVHQAVDRYGTQLSASRGYLSAAPYVELEHLLSQIFGGYALVTATTTLGHQIALPVLATEHDAIVLDNQVHYSVQMAATLARAGGAQVEIVKHRQLDAALEKVATLARGHKTVWFACDGVYSMYGDLAPVGLLQQLLDLSPNVRLYVDDAHGMSWAGEHGCGSFLSRFPFSERIVLASSLNKAFSAGGGVLVFPTAEERERVRLTGGPLSFSGPLQPPMLGAAVASARLHLSPEITAHQARLRARVDQCNTLLIERGLPLLVQNESPIFFVRTGPPKVAFELAERVREDGILVTPSMYPTVPMKRSGIRLSITASHSAEDIARAVDALARHMPGALAHHGMRRDDLEALFDGAVPSEALLSEAYRAPESVAQVVRGLTTGVGSAVTASDGDWAQTGTTCAPSDLRLTHYRTIRDIPRDLWDRHLGAVGSCSWDAQCMNEQAFTGRPAKEDNWEFHYLRVDGPDGRLLALTFFTEMLNKDDMLMRDEVSRAVEHRRRADPYFLTSKILGMGSALSEGEHLYLDRDGPWRTALSVLLQAATDLYDANDLSMLLLRDFPGADPEMDAFMLDQGFVKIPMFDSNEIAITWADRQGHLSALSRRKRKFLRERIDRAPMFSSQVFQGLPSGPRLSDADIAFMHQMYLQVADRKLRINVFPLPADLLAFMQDSPAWEILCLYLSPESGGPKERTPVAWYAAHHHGDDYAPFFCGLDYRYVYTHGAYRQMVFECVRRAETLGVRHVHMGMDAELEKSRVGATPKKNCVYLQARDHYQGELLRDIVAEVGLDDGPWNKQHRSPSHRAADKWHRGGRK